MATAEDLLQRAAARKQKAVKKFIPEKRRSWDYAVHQDDISKNINQEQISEQYNNKNRTNTGTETGTYSNKIRNNQEQISEQTKNESRNKNRNKVKALESRTIPKNNIIQNTKSEADIIKTLRKTSGYQQKIMEQITSHIKSLEKLTNTVNLSIATLALRINADKDTTRTSIKRLQKKSILIKDSGERGRHGTTQVIVPDFIIKECLNLYDCTPLSLDEIGYKNRNENRNSGIINSSSYINITTTDIEISDHWQKINMEPLHDIGFSMTQLKQLTDKNTPEIVQESINHFAYGLEHNPKTQKYDNPLNVLMGVLRKGQGWFEQNYESPQERAMRLYAEQKKARMEREKAMEEELFTLHFQEWMDSQDSESLKKMLPDSIAKSPLQGPKTACWREHYQKHCWPDKRARLFTEMGLTTA